MSNARVHPASINKYLHRLYYTPSEAGSYSSASKLYQAVKRDGKYKLTLKDVQKWLAGQSTYTLHKPARKSYPTSRVIVAGLYNQIDADLMDMSRYAKANKNIRFVLIAIDVFSRYLWVSLLQSKSANQVVKGFKDIFNRQPRMFKTIRTDKGGEFVNATLKRFFKNRGIHHFVTHNLPKANYAEIIIKNLKQRIFRYFTEHQTHQYVNILSDIVHSYNNTVHSSIKIAPVDVNENNQQEIWDRLYLPTELYARLGKRATKRTQFKFKVGDYVRISYLKEKFTRYYDQSWTSEIFQISQRKMRDHLPVYRVRDYNGENIIGTFYEPELQKITYNPDTLYTIERVLYRRRIGNKTFYKVKWLNWPNRFNSFIDSRQIRSLRSQHQRP